MLLNEFDANKQAVINTEQMRQPKPGMPKVAVSCFSCFTFERLCKSLEAVPFAVTSTANMDIPIYKAEYNGVEVALFMSVVGASGCVMILEDVLALGVEKIVLFGNCGVLDGAIEDCSIIIPNAAMRDEGTSYHYAPAADEIVVNPKYKEEFIEILEKYSCSYTEGKIWTTDAMYRETREKVERRKAQGCICVDMECAAVAALSQFREKDIFIYFHAADNLDAEEWDARSIANTSKVLEKDKIAYLAMDLAAKMSGD